MSASRGDPQLLLQQASTALGERQKELGEDAVIEEIIILGAGTSGCVPDLACLMPGQPPCPVCRDAASSKSSRNRRKNTSAAVRYRARGEDRLRTVLVDCGKSFYASALEHLVPAGVSVLEAVLLTHGHADAIMGIDDLRHWKPVQPVVDVWADASTLAVVGSVFPYLVDSSQASGGGDVAAVRFNAFVGWDSEKRGAMGSGSSPSRLTSEGARPHGSGGGEARHGCEEQLTARRAKLDGTTVVEAEQAEFVLPGGLRVLPVRVPHGLHPDGSTYWANGFLFNGTRLVYISDTTLLSEACMSAIRSRSVGPPMWLPSGRPAPPGVGVLMVDCLSPEGSHRSHACWPQTAAIIDGLAPQAAVLVGMAHEIDYAAFQLRMDSVCRVGGVAALQAGARASATRPARPAGLVAPWPGRVEVGYDGMRVRLPAPSHAASSSNSSCSIPEAASKREPVSFVEEETNNDDRIADSPESDEASHPFFSHRCRVSREP